ncbi:uncharacterized protein BT62DRAFT_1078097 [Guyanagaster necrorhizus]|uniref:Carboxymuconolactone decarboxylase-like domain-containing protein n=1 Tax=Guyanagaster necrorhizus TaxID=856835 RepID=A0A9P7VNV6_9AGAR|nr:uncharacterized protein BT62DRAFT_1078097 [Guyanagaster necrorhizus MCA 3950]KAG7443907.1 hypothetical protein BT62DRAFT_1078097 [Guyanagaster necrorhizus MCA 3950]
MAAVATHEFLTRLEALYPMQARGFVSPWSLVAATTFSASNLPEAVPEVFKYALKGVNTHDERQLLVRKLKDALFKSGLLSGYPKAINALSQLHPVTPTELRDTKPLRDLSLPIKTWTKIGQEYFDRTYGDTAATVQPFLKELYPDFEFFSTTFGYGYTYGYFGALSAAETSFTMVAALIANDTPRQVDWHLKGSLRNGATLDEVRAVRQIALDVARASGVQWKNEIPDIEA